MKKKSEKRKTGGKILKILLRGVLRAEVNFGHRIAVRMLLPRTFVIRHTSIHSEQMEMSITVTARERRRQRVRERGRCVECAQH